MKNNSGFSLLEVLISIVILAIGLLGLAGLQTKSTMMNNSSYFRGVATDLAIDLSDHIRANRTPFVVSTDSTSQPALPPDFSLCRPTTGDIETITCAAQTGGRVEYLLTTDFSQWYQNLRTQLPNATFFLVPQQVGSFFRYRLTIAWTDDHSQLEAENSGVTDEQIIDQRCLDDLSSSCYRTVIE